MAASWVYWNQYQFYLLRHVCRHASEIKVAKYWMVRQGVKLDPRVIPVALMDSAALHPPYDKPLNRQSSNFAGCAAWLKPAQSDD